MLSWSIIQHFWSQMPSSVGLGAVTSPLYVGVARNQKKLRFPLKAYRGHFDFHIASAQADCLRCFHPRQTYGGQAENAEAKDPLYPVNPVSLGITSSAAVLKPKRSSNEMLQLLGGAPPSNPVRRKPLRFRTLKNGIQRKPYPMLIGDLSSLLEGDYLPQHRWISLLH